MPFFEVPDYDELRSAARRESTRRWLTAPRLLTVSAVLVIVGAVLISQADLVFGGPPVLPFGTEGRVFPFVFAIQKVESQRVIGTGVLARRAEGVYKVVSVSVRNEDEVNRAVNESSVSVIDSQGKEFLPVCRIDFGSCAEILPQTFVQRILPPGQEQVGIFVFDVPTESTGFLLRIIDNPITGSAIVFDLD